ncbi:MAG TPA: methyltransferase domain-containing protein [Streptosporangiaceae bacterium]|jgi:SAM-dependent methyltransferase
MPAAESYLHGHHDSVLRSHRWRTAENSAGYLLPHLRAADRVLDVGCGPGTITAGLAARVAQVTGVDAAPDVLAAAREAVAGLPNAVVEAGDVYHLGYPDDAFDVVHAHQLLQHLADPPAALREMRRVCRPGGLIAARDGDYGGMLWYPADAELAEWRALYQQVARASGGEPDAGRHLLAWAHAAGLAEVTATASCWCYAAPADRRWWGASWAERVTSSQFAERAVAHGLAAPADLERLSRAWRRFAASDDGWFMIPSGEILCVVPGPAAEPRRGTGGS